MISSDMVNKAKESLEQFGDLLGRGGRLIEDKASILWFLNLWIMLRL